MSDFKCSLSSKNKATKLFTDNGQMLDLSTFRGRVLEIAFEPGSVPEQLYTQFEKAKFAPPDSDGALVGVVSKKLGDITTAAKRHVLYEASPALVDAMEANGIMDVTKLDTMETLKKQLQTTRQRGA